MLFVDISGFTSLVRAAGSRGGPRAHDPRLRAHAGRGPPLRGHGQPVPRRRHHGALRRADRPRGPCAARGARRARHPARRSRAISDELRAARGIEFRVRQGLNTGLVVVGSIGSDLRMDYTAVGDTTNVAARLQQAARARAGRRSPRRRTVSSAATSRPTPSGACVKGKSRAGPRLARSWPRATARTRLDVETERGLTPLRRARARARRAPRTLSHAREAGQGQVVFVVGEPGIGKSRLLHEFRRQIGDERDWLEGRCLSFGRSMAFHPLDRPARRTFRIEERDGRGHRRRRSSTASPLSARTSPGRRPYLRGPALRGPGGSRGGGHRPAAAPRRELRRGPRLLLRGGRAGPRSSSSRISTGSTRRPRVPGRLADSVPSMPVLLILTYRPGYAPPFGDRRTTRASPAGAVGRGQRADGRDMLGHRRLAADARRAASREKAEGNPFFVEEVVVAPGVGAFAGETAAC